MSDIEKIKTDVKDALVKGSVKRALGQTDTPEEKTKLEKLKGWAILGGSIVGVVVFVSLFVGFMKWLFGMLILAGLGYGGFLVVRPKLRELTAKRTEERERLLAAKQADDAIKNAAQQKLDKERSIEEQMAALRAKAQQDN